MTRSATQWREPINLPNGCFIQVIYQGEPLHALTSQVLRHTQGLDMHHAIHERETTFQAPDGVRITIHSRRFASLANPHLICMEYSVSADRECEVDLHTGVDGDVWDINGPHLEQVTASEADGILTVSALTHENSVPLAVSETIVFPAGRSHAVSYKLRPPAGAIREIGALHVQGTLTFHKFIAHFTGLDTPDPLEASRRPVPGSRLAWL